MGRYTDDMVAAVNIAIIDLGTNSIRLDVYQAKPSSSSKIENTEMLYREKLMVRLGEGVYDEGKFSKEAMERTLHAFFHFKRIVNKLEVNAFRIIATSAMRAASNSKKFIKKVKEETGFKIEIISGKEEAALILKGISLDPRLKDLILNKKKFGFFDIGGGSTEIVLSKGNKVKFSDSLELGAVRLKQMFFKKKFSSKKIEKAREHIREVIEEAFFEEADVNKKHFPELLLASSGTSKSIYKLLDDEGEIKKSSLIKLNKKMLEDMKEGGEERLRTYDNFNPRRADIIIPGAILAEELIDFLGVKSAFFTKYALRDGLLVDSLETI